jgi:hypothetical protein
MNDSDYWRWMMKIYWRIIEGDWFRLLKMDNSDFPWDLLKMNDSNYWRWMMKTIEDEDNWRWMIKIIPYDLLMNDFDFP